MPEPVANPTQDAPPSGSPRAPERPLARRRVAVIAVHGVAQHPAGETQNCVADLLLSLSPRHIIGPQYAGETRNYNAARAYESFRVVPIQIPLQPLQSTRVETPEPEPVRDNSGAVTKQTTFSKAWNRLRKSPLLTIFNERSEIFASNLTAAHQAEASKQTSSETKVGPPVGDIGQQYTGLLLEHYKGGAEGNVYITDRLEGRRPGDLTDVDIYEVLWADLAKRNTGFVRFFAALFQLILHLASLSRLTLDTGAHEATGRRWVAFRWVQRIAVRMLQIAAPVTQLVLFIAILSGTAASTGAIHDRLWFPLLFGAIFGMIGGYFYFTRADAVIPANPLYWSLRLLIPPILGTAVAYGTYRLLKLHQVPLPAMDIVGSLCIWLAGGALLFLILRDYEDIRPGALAGGAIVYTLALAVFLTACFTQTTSQELKPDPSHPVTQSATLTPAPLVLKALHHPIDPERQVVIASFITAKFMLGLVRLAIGILIALAILAGFLGCCAWRSLPIGTDLRARARAAVRTSRLTLALPTVLFTVVTMILWSAIFYGADKLGVPTYLQQDFALSVPFALETPGESLYLLPTTTDVDLWTGKKPATTQAASRAATPAVAASCAKPAEAPCSKPADQTDLDVRNTLVRAFSWTIGPQLPVTLALLAIAAGLLGSWVLPSVVTEQFPERASPTAPRDTSALKSRFLGAWLSAGLDATSVITGILWISVFLAPVVFIVLQKFHVPVASERFLHITEIIVAAITALAIAIIAGAVRDGGAFLGIVLDVDTYLRTSPYAATPRARIFERYISTLRYVDDYRDAQDKSYDAVVIFAHSLGALISGDLLHFLKSGYSAENKLTIPNFHLFTMGNPTRQLLNRFFPYLYDWVSPQPDNSLGPLPPPDPVPPATVLLNHPSAQDLGVHRWVNAYRSGDYVGRQLWLPAWYQRNPDGINAPTLAPPTIITSTDGSRQELCIGAGAHTHYMDDTAPDIAWVLNSLI